MVTKKKIQEISSAWKQNRRMKRLAVGPMITPGYSEWWVKRINDNTPKSSPENSQTIEEHLRIIPSELEIIKQDFERKNADLENRIEQMEEEKMNLRLDIDVQKLENEKLRKGKDRVKEELGSLKTDYKKLLLSIRTAGLGKTSEQWRTEIREEKNKVDIWEQKFQEVQTRNETLEKSLSESQKEKGELKDRVIELERSLHLYRNQNSAIELRTSLSKIEEMKKRIDELEAAMQNCEIRIKYLEANESRNNKQLHYFQNQVRNRDHIMEEAVVQIREVTDHIQSLAVQADILTRELKEVKDSMVHFEEDDEDPVYPSDFTPINVQPDMRPQGAPLTIKSQQYQTDTLAPMTRSIGSRSNLRNNLANPIALDNPAEIKQARVEYPDTIKAPKRKGNKGDNAGRYSKGHSKPITVGRRKTETTSHQSPLKHSIENCTAFKKIVERLINIGIIKFDKASSAENPLPNHIDNRVNAIYEKLGSVHINDI
ncbi:uncharacterized protein LOC128034773 [Gossypium raimondii]|uniref:uncharacterized protein LOC128034773 n=1 Tax=Gossypium raimondii TaxID=29730 RepID=UPI00227B6B59|nr:uncharacterized protein LOC128034773 [Gossypium raimondii]